jgi:hypothetical protein
MVEAKNFLLFKREKQDVKRVVWMGIPSLTENGVSPKLNFDSLVGLSSFL